jgi:Zn-dependent protease
MESFLHDWISGLAILILILTAYTCVVCHEYGHALTARHLGYRAIHITLWPFAGLASLDGEWHEKGRHEFWIAVNGPLVNVALALIGLPIMLLWPNPISIFFVKINAILLGFNLIPVYPMDGGRILRSLLTMNMGDWWRATVISRYVAIVTAILTFPILWCYWSPVPAVLIALMAFLSNIEVRVLKDKKELQEAKKKLDDFKRKSREGMIQAAKKEANDRHPEDEDARELLCNELIYFGQWIFDVTDTIIERVTKANRELSVELLTKSANKKTEAFHEFMGSLSPIERRYVCITHLHATGSRRQELIDKFLGDIDDGKRPIPAPEAVLLETVDGLKNMAEQFLERIKQTREGTNGKSD